MIAFRRVRIQDANFIHELMTVQDYECIFYEKNTSVEEWENRIELLIKERGTDNYIIYDSILNKKVGWIMYEVKKDICFLHLIVIDYKELKKGYGYNALQKLVQKLKSKNIKKIFLDVQKSNLRAVNFYKKFGFIIIGSEEQVVGHNKIQEYLNMEFVL